MKKLTFIIALALFSCNSTIENKIWEKQSGMVSKPFHDKKRDSTSNLKEGDIIFQSSSGGQGKAIQIATNSKYSHVGILYKEGNEFYVFEAVQPVKMTPLKKWIDRGDNAHYVIKRLKNPDAHITPESLKKIKALGKQYLGKDYDLYFGWSDDKIYCSELVWKLYKGGLNIELGSLQKLKEFNLNHPIVQYKLKERYGNNIPYDEKVISPAAIFDCDKLEEIERN